MINIKTTGNNTTGVQSDAKKQEGPLKKAVLWAIDPFEHSARPEAGGVMRLLKWTNLMGYDLQPVYVLSMLDRVDGKFIADDLIGFIPNVEAATKNYLDSLGVKIALPIKVLLNPTASRAEAIKSLLRLSEEVGSPWIVVSSHGRTGLSRLAFGSFSENLLLQSKFPVLFLSHGAQAKEQDGFGKILFPTDFSAASKAAFERVILQAKQADVEVVVFYSNNISGAVLASLEAPGMIPVDYLDRQENEIRTEGEKWIAHAKAQDVRAKLIVKEDGVIPLVGESILQVAENEGAGLISMSCASGALVSFAAGSVARDVFRAGQYPVLVYGPKARP